MNDDSHQDGIHPFPAAMQAHEIETNGITVGKLEEKPMLYYNGRSKMQEHFVTIVLKRRRDDRPDRDG